MGSQNLNTKTALKNPEKQWYIGSDGGMMNS
jgi:hypothetical protein